MIRRFNSMAVIVLLIVLLTSVTGCKQEPAAPAEKTAVYKITVCAGEEIPLSGVKVFVYEDEALSELVAVNVTDEDGTISFQETAFQTYVAVLENVPIGLDCEPTYRLQTDTVITLENRAVTEEEMVNSSIALGDRMPEFTVVDSKKTVHSLYGYLENKKAVVLNFWFLNCGPCKMEFPYIQEAYEQWNKEVAFLALNPVDGTDEAINLYQAENALTFPMASCSVGFQSMLNLTAYPTTVIVDRYGYVCLIHKGMFTDSSTLSNALSYFVQGNYETKTFDLIEQIPVAG